MNFNPKICDIGKYWAKIGKIIIGRWTTFAKTLNMRYIITFALASLILLSCKTKTDNMNTLSLTQDWDKTFPKSELVNHSKVTFHNRYGIELAADMYVPKDAEGNSPPSLFPVHLAQ